MRAVVSEFHPKLQQKHSDSSRRSGIFIELASIGDILSGFKSDDLQFVRF